MPLGEVSLSDGRDFVPKEVDPDGCGGDVVRDLGVALLHTGPDIVPPATLNTQGKAAEDSCKITEKVLFSFCSIVYVCSDSMHWSTSETKGKF